MTDLVAIWDVALSDGVHKIEFEHGTTSGKRVVYVDGKEEIRKEWMFKLVGKETFCVGSAKTKATINIDAVSGFAYEYTLEINGKSLKKYMENRSKTTNTWVLHLDDEDFRVVLEVFILQRSPGDPVVKHLEANWKISSNPLAALREKDVAVCFHKDYSLGNPIMQFYSVLQGPYELESTRRQHI
ncbi:fas apoptotic inhibitory molecule 1 isoform 3-T3 [Dugong dugon]